MRKIIQAIVGRFRPRKRPGFVVARSVYDRWSNRRFRALQSSLAAVGFRRDIANLSKAEQDRLRRETTYTWKGLTG